ncbi:30S ribosomal protein S4 [Patescibacteria group bacterium]|nr:30S ribosomal protein S4 [Patescibacteria group bacterium]MBU4115887.1 30S ribosomal protein S4 [Patescibacteria group bacterium]
MIIGPKYKICKRLGSGVFEKCQTEKFALAQSKTGRTKKSSSKKRPRAMTNYGRQLIEKQKTRFTYGISENQFSNYVKKSIEKKKTPPSEELFKFLESRLDNVVYRLGFAKTRRMARQIVSHGHITVNGRRLSIPSYNVKVGDKISIKNERKNNSLFINLDKEIMDMPSIPPWISLNLKNKEGILKNAPVYNPSDLLFDLQSVIEFYNR